MAMLCSRFETSQVQGAQLCTYIHTYIRLQFFLCVTVKDAEFLAGIWERLLGTLCWSKTISAMGNQLQVEDMKFLVVAAVSPERSQNR